MTSSKNYWKRAQITDPKDPVTKLNAYFLCRGRKILGGYFIDPEDKRRYNAKGFIDEFLHNELFESFSIGDKVFDSKALVNVAYTIEDIDDNGTVLLDYSDEYEHLSNVEHLSFA